MERRRSFVGEGYRTCRICSGLDANVGVEALDRHQRGVKREPESPSTFNGKRDNPRRQGHEGRLMKIIRGWVLVIAVFLLFLRVTLGPCSTRDFAEIDNVAVEVILGDRGVSSRPGRHCSTVIMAEPLN